MIRKRRDRQTRSGPRADESPDDRLRRLMASRRLDAAVDVGANRGAYVDRLRSDLDFHGRIIALEPDPQLFDLLCAGRVGDASFTGLCLAAGAEESRATLNRVLRAPGLNSLLDASDAGTARFGAFDSVEPVDVEVRTLDDAVLPLVGDDERLLLKIDTQGYELEVLRGATELLGRVDLLQLEVPAIELYTGMAGAAELLGFVREHGFDLVDLLPGGRDREGVFLLDFDVVAARREEAGG